MPCSCSVAAELCLFDKQGRHIPAAAYPLVAFAEDEDDERLHARAVGQSPATSGVCGGWLYQLEGVEVGLATVRFSAQVHPIKAKPFVLTTANHTIEVRSLIGWEAGETLCQSGAGTLCVCVCVCVCV